MKQVLLFIYLAHGFWIYKDPSHLSISLPLPLSLCHIYYIYLCEGYKRLRSSNWETSFYINLAERFRIYKIQTISLSPYLSLFLSVIYILYISPNHLSFSLSYISVKDTSLCGLQTEKPCYSFSLLMDAESIKIQSLSLSLSYISPWRIQVAAVFKLRYLVIYLPCSWILNI